MPKNQYETVLLGVHTSIAGSIEKSIYRAEELHINVMQIFTKSNRQWNAKPLTEQDIQDFKTKLAKSSIQDVIVHASYLINIGASDKRVEQTSMISLIDELQRCNQLNIKYLVLHPGSNKIKTQKEALNQVIKNINISLEKTTGDTILTLENMAGQGNSLCSSFEQLGYIIQNIEQQHRIGICFDTCHAYAAGYDFSNHILYDAMWREFDEKIGLSFLKVVHLNDSKKILGSRVDRHESITKGKIAQQAFNLIINDSKLIRIPKILETPIERPKDYEKDLEVLINMINEENSYFLTNNPLQYYKKK
ncbi:MAG TPA: deoxyribonuclease IV [Candidatus Babeliales bacterium]|nr:deoxyribonuclease IV [Candidatus Babeliales bacterium]